VKDDIPTIEKGGYSIPEWCGRYSFSRSHFYNMDKKGLAPETKKVLGRRIITREADDKWRNEGGAK